MANTSDYNSAELQAYQRVAERIERTAELKMDTLDGLLIAGDISQADYGLAVLSLNKWIDEQYDAR